MFCFLPSSGRSTPIHKASWGHEMMVCAVFFLPSVVGFGAGGGGGGGGTHRARAGPGNGWVLR